MSNGTSITEKSVTQNHVFFTSRQTEYSQMQVSLDVVRHQMAPASVTRIQLYQNCMLFASRRNRIFLDACTFHCKKALAPMTIQLDQHRMLLTSSRKRIFLGAGALGHYLLSSNGTSVGDNSVASKLNAFARRCDRIFSEAGAFGCCLLSNGIRIGDKSVRSKSHSIYKKEAPLDGQNGSSHLFQYFISFLQKYCFTV
jgi:hypothetical protein